MDAQRDFPLVLSIRLMATFGSDETSAIFISGIHTQCMEGAQR